MAGDLSRSGAGGAGGERVTAGRQVSGAGGESVAAGEAGVRARESMAWGGWVSGARAYCWEH